MVRFTLKEAQAAPRRIISSEMRQVVPTTRTTAPSLLEQMRQRPSFTSSSARAAPTRIIGSEMRQVVPTTRTTAPSLLARMREIPTYALDQGSPTNIPLPSMGGAARNLPTGRSVVSPVLGDRTGIVPPSTLATQGAFGGENGGMGAAAAAAAPASVASDLGLGGIGESISSIGNSIVDTVKEYLPLAIKVILAVIIIKIVLWLLRGRR